MKKLLLRDNVKMAMMELRSSQWRSTLTMLGVIIGVMSVVTVFSIGEGIKRQITAQIDQLGKNVLTIRPGQSGTVVNPVDQIQGMPQASGTFTPKDLRVVATTDGVQTVVPLGLVSAPVGVDGNETSQAFVLASTADMPHVFKQRVKFGGFFSAENTNDNVAVIGRSVAEEIFRQEVPLGRSFDLLGQTFIVRGIFDEFDESPVSLAPNMNNAIVVPYERAQALTNGTLQTYQLLALADPSRSLKEVAGSVSQRLQDEHGGQQNFAVQRQDETLAATDEILSIVTVGIAAVAAISLLVGGVGIMNVMLVSVAERVHEIGIRKAIGATSRQIMGQFLIEAIIVSVSGGVVGVLLALLITAGVNVFTDFHAVINWLVALVAIAVSAAVGIIFGTAPAVKAARKDPIQALRRE